jgi:hypothetical protein
MTSDGDELEEALRQNLKLRRDLATNIAKTEAASQQGGTGYRLGRVLYWACLALIGLLRRSGWWSHKTHLGTASS